MDTVTLSRIQFGLNIGFHYLFPPLSIGLGVILVIMEGAFLKTKNPIYETMTRFWVRVFALIFAIGVASGLVQVFAFGNNWATFSRFVGDVFGSLLGAEGVFAFFLESGFLAILLFGWEKVSPRIYFLSTVIVALGAHFSGVWIVMANSWMQTPDGYKIVGEGAQRHAVITDFWKVLFTPSTIDRLTHVILGCWIAGSFLVLSVSAYYLIKRIHLDFATRSFKIALIVGSIAVVLQLVSADSTARGVAVNQPIKLAAFEGIYKTETPTGMYAFGIVDSENQTVRGLALPGFLSFLVYRNFHTPVQGLDQYPKEYWPNVPVVFQTYHGMIALWGLMAITVILALVAWKRKKIMESKWMLRLCVIAVIFPELANELGWFSAEMGRQPWIVQGVMRTSEGVSRIISSGQVIGSLIMFSLVYLFVFALFIYLLNEKIKHGPGEEHHAGDQVAPYHNEEKVIRGGN